MREKYFSATVCLLASLLITAPATAISVAGLRQEQQRGDTTIAESAAKHKVPPASLHGFLPGLVGPHLYVYLLQSDQFITLQGLLDDYWDKRRIIKTP